MKKICLISLLLIAVCIPGFLYSQDYAFIYIEDGSTTNSVGTTWTNAGAGLAADFTEATTSAYWSLSSNVLTAANNAAVDGNYCIKYSLSFKAAAADWSVGISIDGAAPEEPVFVRSITNTRKDVGNVSGIYMASIEQNQTVELVVKSNSGTPIDFTPVYAQLVICPAAQNSNNYYAGMHIDAVANSTVSTTFSKVAGFSAVPQLNGWSFGSNAMTASAGSSGLYYLSFSVSYSGEGNESSPVIYTFEVARNDSNGVSHIMTNRSNASTDIGNVSGGGLISIDEGDIISLEAKSHLANKNLSIRKATISLFKMGDTTPNAVGGMTITSDQTITINAESEWTTVGNYSLKSANNWGLSSNVFTLNSTDAYGYYYLEFTSSLTTASASGDEFEMGVFVGTSLNPSFTVKRTLSSNTDVGAVCGVGLFQADGPDSTVTIKIQNVSSSNNFTIKKSMLGFSQIRYVYSDTPLPISLTRFDAVPDNGTVHLTWETASEIYNAAFLIYRNDDLIASVEGAGHSTELRTYDITDEHVVPGITYTYVLADQHYNGQITKYTNLAKTVMIDAGNVTRDYSIGNTYPNPFNPTAAVPVTLTAETRVNAELYDVSGKRVQVIYQGILDPGSHDLMIDGQNLNTGLYFVKMTLDDDIEYQKVTLLK